MNESVTKTSPNFKWQWKFIKSSCISFVNLCIFDKEFVLDEPEKENNFERVDLKVLIIIKLNSSCNYKINIDEKDSLFWKSIVTKKKKHLNYYYHRVCWRTKISCALYEARSRWIRHLNCAENNIRTTFIIIVFLWTELRSAIVWREFMIVACIIACFIVGIVWPETKHCLPLDKF